MTRGSPAALWGRPGDRSRTAKVFEIEADHGHRKTSIFRRNISFWSDLKIL